jgi:hypothetical protein
MFATLQFRTVTFLFSVLYQHTCFIFWRSWIRIYVYPEMLATSAQICYFSVFYALSTDLLHILEVLDSNLCM